MRGHVKASRGVECDGALNIHALHTLVQTHCGMGGALVHMHIGLNSADCTLYRKGLSWIECKSINPLHCRVHRLVMRWRRRGESIGGRGREGEMLLV